MNRRTRLIIAGAALSCIIGLTLLLIFNDPVRGVVLDPLIDGINAFRYTLGYFPQDIEWLVFLLIVTVVVAVMVSARLPKNDRPAYVPFTPPFPNEGPAMKLAKILDNSNLNKFRRERVILELRDLAARTVAYHRGISIEEATATLDTPDWTENASVRDFLSLDKHRAGKNDPKEFHAHVEHALTHIERMHLEV